MTLVLTPALLAQKITVAESVDQEINSLLLSIRNTMQFGGDRVAIRLVESAYITTDEVAGLDGDVVVHRLLISIQQMDDQEKTTHKSYWVDGNFFNPRTYKFDTATKRLTFLHGVDEQPKSTNLVITATGLHTE
ncbi:MAG: hypothetical protein RIF36_18105 [Imperialibacter sp.]|uniref:hypothetical protein n=1 Tax=Imperialibacter sp. TaxID=2038411 RepID=UPI0032EB22AE